MSKKCLEKAQKTSRIDSPLFRVVRGKVLNEKYKNRRAVGAADPQEEIGVVVG